MAAKIENWEELRALYVIHNKSHREIAHMAGCSNSTISVRARKEDWDGQRMAYRASIAQRGYENAAAVVANENAGILRENILLARAYLRLTAQAMKDGTIKPNAKDALEMMRYLTEQLAPLANEGTGDGPRIIEGSAVSVGGAGSDFLRRLVEVARTRVAPPGGLGGDAVGDPPATRTN